mmetsp:Transcript_5428/g.16411  ORF Transcript_5428/g.16411 Transcript_5428/m.16411 type:complete len:225 (-) Transcript_5428:63-737(-)
MERRGRTVLGAVPGRTTSPSTRTMSWLLRPSHPGPACSGRTSCMMQMRTTLPPPQWARETTAWRARARARPLASRRDRRARSLCTRRSGTSLNPTSACSIPPGGLRTARPPRKTPISLRRVGQSPGAPRGSARGSVLGQAPGRACGPPPGPIPSPAFTRWRSQACQRSQRRRRKGPENRPSRRRGSQLQTMMRPTTTPRWCCRVRCPTALKRPTCTTTRRVPVR